MVLKKTTHYCCCHLCAIYQNTAQGNKSQGTGWEMCSQMHLPLPGVSFQSRRWMRTWGKKLKKLWYNSILWSYSLAIKQTVGAFCVFLCSYSCYFSVQSLSSTFCFSFSGLSRYRDLFVCLPTSEHVLPHTYTHCQTGNVPGIHTVEPTGGLAPYDHE